MPVPAWIAVLVLAMLSLPTPASQRVALVVGNASYAHAPALANPLNDAADIGAVLGRLGFSVTRLENAGYAALRRGLQEFARAASASEIAVVYYAGHGIEVDRRNFLVPVDARLASDQDVEFEAVPLELVSRAVERASGLRLVILDACRENPFAVRMQRAGGDALDWPGGSRGWSRRGRRWLRTRRRRGRWRRTVWGRNSPYSEALLAHLEEPGLEVGLLFRKVRDAVLASTGGRQEPFVYGSLSSRGVYLAAAPAPGVSASGSPGASERMVAERLASERLFWESVKDSEEPADFRAYLERYPDGEYEALARNRLMRLEVAATSEPAATGAVSPPAPEPVTYEVSSPSALAAPPPKEVEASLELERSARRRIQQGLASLGLSPGPVDGLFGSLTRSAIRSYQEERGLPVTGHLDGESAKVLLAAADEDRRGPALAVEDGAVSSQVSRNGRESAGHATASDAGSPPTARPSEIFLASGLSLSDWALLAEDRLASGDFRSLLVEGAGHARKYGTIGSVDSVVERAIVGLIEDVSVVDEASARSALEVIDRIKDVSGERVPLSRIEATANARLGRFEQAAQAYRSWLRLAPGNHPERKVMATGLQMVLRGERPWHAIGPFRDCAECPEMTVLPPGTYRMGSRSDEEGRFDDEGPDHDVTIPESLAVGMYEVTFAEWDACHLAGGCSHKPADNGWGREDLPVVNVSWEDAQEYVRWLSAKTGKEYRLLTESEWEYAARARTTTRYHWGDEPGRNRANCRGCRTGTGTPRPFRVGSFAANDFGLFDVHGNVWEWVEDCWHRNYGNAPSDGSAWVTSRVPRSCRHRILRGGSWNVGPRNVRSAVRSRFAERIHSDTVGFRIVRTMQSAPAH